MDWIKEMEKIMSDRGWSGTQLAKEMGFSQQYIQKVMKKESPPSAILKAKILDRRAHDVTIDVLLEMLPEEASKILKELNEKKLKKLVNKNGDQ